MERCHIAHDQDGRGLRVLRDRGDGLQGAVIADRVSREPFGQHTGRRLRRFAVIDEVPADLREIAESHQEHKGAFQFREGFVVLFRGVRVRGGVAGDDRKGAGRAPVGDRDAEVLRDRDGRGDAGHQFEGDAGRLQCECLLAAPPEDEAVAAFEPRDPFSLVRFGDEERGGLFLGHAVSAAAFSNEDLLGGLQCRVTQKVFVQQVIIEDDIGTAQRFQPPDRDEPGTGAGTDECDTHSLSSSPISAQMRSRSNPAREVLRSPSRADRR